MAAGDTQTFERAKPATPLLGKRLFFLGPASQGSTVKLVSNHIAGLHNLARACKDKRHPRANLARRRRSAFSLMKPAASR